MKSVDINWLYNFFIVLISSFWSLDELLLEGLSFCDINHCKNQWEWRFVPITHHLLTSSNISNFLISSFTNAQHFIPSFYASTVTCVTSFLQYVAASDKYELFFVIGMICFFYWLVVIKNCVTSLWTCTQRTSFPRNLKQAIDFIWRKHSSSFSGSQRSTDVFFVLFCFEFSVIQLCSCNDFYNFFESLCSNLISCPDLHFVIVQLADNSVTLFETRTLSPVNSTTSSRHFFSLVFLNWLFVQVIKI